MHHHLKLTLVLLIAGLAACSNPVDSNDDDPDPIDTHYDVQVNLWRIEILGDCDANVALGLPNQGEFHYRVDVAYETVDGETVTDDYVVGQPLYGNPREGEMEKRNSGESLEFSELHGNDVSSLFTAREGSEYEIQLYMIEWDGNTADDRMKGDAVTRTVQVDNDGILINLEVGSSSDCKAVLKGNTLHALSNP